MASPYYNPFYDDPNLKTVSSNIAKIFVDPNPGQTMVARRQAQYYDLKNDQLSSEASSRSRIAAAFRNGGALNPGELAALGVSGYLKPDDVSGYTLYYDANTGAPDDVTARAYVGTGKAIGKDQGFSIGDREAVAGRENAAALNRTATSAGIAASASRDNNAARIQYMIDHPDEAHVKGSALNDFIKSNPTAVGSLFLKPQNTPAGGQTNFAPGDPRAGSDAVVVTGPPSASAGKPTKVSPNDAADIEYSAISDVGGLSADGKAVDDDFRKMFGAKMPAAKQAAIDEYQRTGNPALASEAYRKALGIEPGARFKPAGTPLIGSGPAAMVGPDARPPPAAAVPSAPPPPPLTPTERKAGAIYSTPKGPMQWTGTGWVPVGR